MSYLLFDDRYYIDRNPDIRQAIGGGAFSSGLEHFQDFGIREVGRELTVSPFWTPQQEQLYLQLNPDVNSAVRRGQVASGLGHFILFGEQEGRAGGVFNLPPSPSYFNEGYYLARHRDLGRPYAAGVISSGLDHFTRFGQYESGRRALFSGSGGNDAIAAFGLNTQITGVSYEVSDASTEGEPRIRPVSTGVGEQDILIGGPGRELFLLGTGNEGFYEGQGLNDFAIVRNFDLQGDRLRLNGSPNEYSLVLGSSGIPVATPQAVSILTSAGDLVAVVEGVSTIEARASTAANTFIYVATA